jgi:uncharacterized delta-60 repeat protein
MKSTKSARTLVLLMSIILLGLVSAMSQGQSLPGNQFSGAPVRPVDLTRLQNADPGNGVIRWNLPNPGGLPAPGYQIPTGGSPGFHDAPVPSAGDKRTSGSMSQVVPEAWAKTYSSDAPAGYEIAQYVVVDGSGNTYVSGLSTNLPYGSDIYTIKYDASGSVVWGVRYDGPAHNDDAARGIAVDAAGNVYVVGSSLGADKLADYVTVKYNSSGVQQWASRYDNGSADYPVALAVDQSGNVFVTGYSSNGMNYDVATVKYNASGIQQWAARYDDGSYDYASAIALDVFGNVIVGGYFWNGTIDVFGVIKYSPTGSQLWLTKYDNGLYQYITAMTLDPSGNIYAVGNSQQGTTWGITAVKFNSSGVQQWIAQYKPVPTSNYFSRGIGLDAAGNIYLGVGPSPAKGSSDYVVLKLKPSGTQEWEATYDGGSYDYLQAMTVDAAGNTYLAGYGYILPVTTVQYIVVKFNSAGVQQWVGLYKGPGAGSGDYAAAIAVDGSGNVAVTGYSYSGTSLDYATVRFVSSGGRLWASRYDGPGGGPNDYAKSVVSDASGNVYVTGWSYTGAVSVGILPSIVTAKYNSSGVQQWVVRYNGGGSAVPAGIGVDAAGNVYIAGAATNGGNSDYVTIKYSPTGVQLWSVRYNNLSYDIATCMVVDSSGNVCVTGYSYESAYDVATIKYNSSGVQQWVARYEWGFAAVPQGIALDASGNIYVTGYSQTATASSFLAMKYTASGVQQWVAQYKGTSTSTDQGLGVAVDGSGNSYVVGLSNASSTNDVVIVKYSPAGVQQWVAKYDNGAAESSPFIAADNAGNVYVTAQSPNAGVSQIITIKYNTSGQQQWLTRYSNGSFDSPYAIKLSPSGNVYVTGASYRDGFMTDCVTIKYNSAGLEQWVGRYSGPAHSSGSWLAIDNAENVYVAGKSYGSGWTIMLTMKYDSASGAQRVNRKPAFVSRTPASVAQVTQNKIVTFSVSASDPDGDRLFYTWKINGLAVTAGYDSSLTSAFQFSYNTPVVLTVVFSDPGGLKDSTTWNFTITSVANESSLPREFALGQNYPNPFNPTTDFELRIANRELVSVKVFNMLGVEVATLVDEIRDPGVYTIRWNAASLSSGMYFCQMKAGLFMTVRKALLLK